MRMQKYYTDGTPSKEVEEDWETTGATEYQKLMEKCRTNSIGVLGIRDRLINLADLVTVCQEALNSDHIDQINEVVANTLYFFVVAEIKSIEKELENL